MDQVLPTMLARSSQGDVLARQVPVGDNRGVLGALFLQGSPLLAAFSLLRLGSLGRTALAFLAARMLAVGALLGQPEAVATLMALAVNPHPDGLLDTERMALGRMPLAGRDLDAESLAELFSPLLKDLGSRNPNGTVGCLGCLSSLSGRFTGRFWLVSCPLLCNVIQRHGRTRR